LLSVRARSRGQGSSYHEVRALRKAEWPTKKSSARTTNEDEDDATYAAKVR
jgi:hypothetical protein